VRLRGGFSVPALSRRSGVSVSTIRRIEQRTTVPRPHVVRALSAALSVAPWQIAEFLPVLVRVGLPEPTVLAS
jgi:transcriptional regulator with XRE-family HTH domain